MTTSHFDDIATLCSHLGYDVGDALDEYKWEANEFQLDQDHTDNEHELDLTITVIVRTSSTWPKKRK